MFIINNWKIQHMEQGEERDLTVASPDYTDHFWLPAKVPGDVHSTLIEQHILEHPFFAQNDQKARWVEQKVWWYRTEFTWDDEVGQDERVLLTFDGLDTFATIFLNGREMAASDNMFVPLTLDVTREIRRGKNWLAVKFDPISERVKQKDLTFWSGFSKERMWARKAQMNFGWDWGPRLVTAGIWKPVQLEKRKSATWDSVFAYTTDIQINQATVRVHLSANRFVPRVTDYTGENEVTIEQMSAEVSLSLGTSTFTGSTVFSDDEGDVQITVDNPQLWWTHELGHPTLYDLKAVLFVGDKPVDEYQCQIGIRSIEVQQLDENGASCFTFVLNGVKMFAKGANWIPVDSFIGAAPDTRYEHLISLAREANMNMLRVWGGGIYEKDVFYDECDRQGILVWQDFMFACAMYPDYNREFMQNVEREVYSVVHSLRNHACLAIWCGNNENDWIYESMASSGTIDTPFYGEKIYHEVMPYLLKKLDPTRLYWPSSPFGGSDHNSAESGDRHNWQVWHGHVYPRKLGEPEKIDYSVEGVSFKNFAKDTATFISEFGMHAAANRYTLEKWTSPHELYWGSAQLAYRNKDYHHPKGILLMEGYTGIPRDLDEYYAFSMLTQAEGLKFGIEHYRRRTPHTSGALYWQLNDCWPGTSWAVIDYELLPKASYYYSKKFFNPILISADMTDLSSITITVINDTRVSYDDEIAIEVIDFTGCTVWKDMFAVHVEENSVQTVTSVSANELLKNRFNHVTLRIRSMNGIVPDNYYYLCDQKDLCLPEAKVFCQIDQEHATLTLRANYHARMITVDIDQSAVIFSDNFFDLAAGETRVIQVRQLDGQPITWSTIKVRALNATNPCMPSMVGKTEE